MSLLQGNAAVKLDERELNSETADESEVEAKPQSDKTADAKAEAKVLNIGIGAYEYAVQGRPHLNPLTRRQALVPVIFADILRHSMVLILWLAVCALCLFKVYQVQDTRSLTSEYNALQQQNAELERRQLTLLAQRQTITEHALIRNEAVSGLGMTAPRTEDEHVITLRFKQ